MKTLLIIGAGTFSVEVEPFAWLAANTVTE